VRLRMKTMSGSGFREVSPVFKGWPSHWVLRSEERPYLRNHPYHKRQQAPMRCDLCHQGRYHSRLL
jgi:hypothetical protein